jgi:hypothetical protein
LYPAREEFVRYEACIEQGGKQFFSFLLQHTKLKRRQDVLKYFGRDQQYHAPSNRNSN